MGIARKALVATLVSGLAGIGLVVGSTAEASASPNCSWTDIGQPGNVYGWNGEYAGQVEQQFNCYYPGIARAHFQWSSPYFAAHRGDSIALLVSSPSGVYSDPELYFEDVQDHYSAGYPIHEAKPDNWRAGAQWNQNGCVAWGTLHSYAGYDVNGPVATCGGNYWIAPG